ncbi:MAG: PhoH family protein [Phycisphaerales bacterium JB059]
MTISVPEGHEQIQMLGSAQRHLKLIREALGVSVHSRDGTIRVSGEPAAVVVARGVLERLAERARSGGSATRQEVLDMIAQGTSSARTSSPPSRGGGAWEGTLEVYAGGRAVRPKTPNQEAYVEAIRTKDLVFGIGPAGTGKTYLAVAAAVHMLREGRAQRLMLVRPAVEAGEKLGFLPGDIEAKVNPYLRPLLDALHDMMDYNSIRRLMESDVMEVAPLAFMRGRTLNNAVIILDEAQNTTRGQMQMFLTRMGHGSKMIVTGDTTQIDLPDPRESGLVDAARRLMRVRGVAFCSLTGRDVVRHELVQRIVEAYGSQEGQDDASRELRRALRDSAPGVLESTSDENAGNGPEREGA